jgi:hypothetical protein
MHLLGQDALDRLQHVRVEAELQDGAGAGIAGELGIQNFVRPGA